MLQKSFVLKVFFLFILGCVSQKTFSSGISEYTENKIDDFLNIHMILTSYDDKNLALEKLNEIKSGYDKSLKEKALDFEQELLILDTLYLMESYHYIVDPDVNRDALRPQMKAQMIQNEKFISKHPKDASKWMYLFTGDVMSFYMTRSVAATFRYGMRVKKLYETALSIDPALTNANLNLGSWMFYAPRIVGGGIDKTIKFYEKALSGARIDGEKYAACIQLSQYYFEKKKMQSVEKYLSEAEKLIPGGKEIALIRKINSMGISLFQYNRNKAGIDEKMKESEMDEDDR